MKCVGDSLLFIHPNSKEATIYNNIVTRENKGKGGTFLTNPWVCHFNYNYWSTLCRDVAGDLVLAVDNVDLDGFWLSWCSTDIGIIVILLVVACLCFLTACLCLLVANASLTLLLEESVINKYKPCSEVIPTNIHHIMKLLENEAMNPDVQPMPIKRLIWKQK